MAAFLREGPLAMQPLEEIPVRMEGLGTHTLSSLYVSSPHALPFHTAV